MRIHGVTFWFGDVIFILSAEQWKEKSWFAISCETTSFEKYSQNTRNGNIIWPTFGNEKGIKFDFSKQYSDLLYGSHINLTSASDFHNSRLHTRIWSAMTPWTDPAYFRTLSQKHLAREATSTGKKSKIGNHELRPGATKTEQESLAQERKIADQELPPHLSKQAAHKPNYLLIRN